MNVTVTGAAGKLGIHVCRALRDLGFSVRATDKTNRRLAQLTLVSANLLDSEACYRLVAGADAVVHLANHSDELDDAQKVFSENVAMNMNVFQAAAECGVRRVIFASSIQVVGDHRKTSSGSSHCVPYLPLDGDTPTNPGNAYALSKLVGETTLFYFSRQGQLTGVAVRFPWLIDPLRHRFPRQMPACATKLEQVFSYLPFADAASLIAAILRAPLTGCRIYLPAHPRNRLGQTASDLIRRYYPTIPLRRPLEAIDALIDISRIQQETGWVPSSTSS
jgi:nucleoside-diphosphate-sugar epimerase